MLQATLSLLTHGTFLRRHSYSNNHESTLEYPCSPNPCDSPTNYESHRPLCTSTNGRADLENQDRGKKYPFDGEGGIHGAEHKLERAVGQEVCRTVPAHAVKSLELVDYSWDSRRKNGVILLWNEHRSLKNARQAMDVPELPRKRSDRRPTTGRLSGQMCEATCLEMQRCCLQIRLT